MGNTNIRTNRIKATGICRRVDELGRVVLPVEIRRVLEIEEHDAMEIYTEGESIILKKHQRGCIFDGEVLNVVEYKGKIICKRCLEELRKAE